MEPNARDRIRREVRAAVYRACWRRLEGDEAGAQAVLSCEVPAVLSQADAVAEAVGDDVVRSWVDEDSADFDRAVLISDLVARRVGGTPHASMARDRAPDTASSPTIVDDPPRRETPGAAPAIADLLDGMLAQERRMRRAS